MAMTIGGKTPQSINIGGKAVQSLAIGGEVVWSATPQIPDYMRLKNISSEAGIFKMRKTGSPTTPNLEYSLDGTTWTTYDFSTLPEVTVAAGETIYFRGTNANQQFNSSNSSFVSFSFNKTCEGHGNICSLFDPDPAVFSTITSIGNFGLKGCFQGCTSLTTAPEFINVTSVLASGIRSCFYDCASLTTAPDFTKMTSVGSSGLMSCFYNCFKLCDVTTPNISDLTANKVLSYWLAGAGTQATGTKVVRVPTGATIATDSDGGIPTGWTRVDY